MEKPIVRATYQPRAGTVLRLRLSARQLAKTKCTQEQLGTALEKTPSRLMICRRALEAYAHLVQRMTPEQLKQEAQTILSDYRGCR